MARVSMGARRRKDNQKRLGEQHLFESRTQTLAGSDIEIEQDENRPISSKRNTGFRKETNYNAQAYS